MTTNQILIGVGLILVLAVGSQVLASRLRIPALIVLLPVGFVAGTLTADVNPELLLGPAFEPLVSLSVAVILYDAGLGLDLRKLKGHTRRVVVRLIVDPVGGILGALTFHAIMASSHKGLGSRLGQFAVSVGVGVAGGAVGAALLWLLLRKLRLGEVLGTTAQLASVIAVAAVCDVARADTGLIAAIFMGLAVANQRGFDVAARRPFFEILVQLILGVLLISISATVTPSSLRHLLLPALGLVAVLVLAARPIAAFASTLRTDLARGERAFVGWMAPRATSRGARLEGITAVFLLTGEDDFNALASALLQGSVAGQVYRLAPPPHSHGVVAPYTGAEILFDDRMTRAELSRRYQHGERIVTRPGSSALPAGHDALFLVRADRRLAAVTESSRPAPQTGDTIVSLGPPPAARRLGTDAGIAATRDSPEPGVERR